jgi:hypothetical protein
MINDEDKTSNLNERVAYLEGRFEEGEKSLSRQFSVWGGIIALTISIMIGCFQIYEYTILRKEEAREANAIQLGTYVRRISELNSDLAGKAISAVTPEQKARVAAEGKVINSEKFSIVRLASRLLREQPEAGGFAAYATLAYELILQGDNETALSYANSALQFSLTKPEKIESMRYVAMVLFAPGATQNIDLARENFRDAIKLAKEEKSYLSNQLVAGVFSNFVVAEVQFGGCAEAKMALNELRTDLSAERFPHILQAALSEIGFSIQGQNRCPNLFSP